MLAHGKAMIVRLWTVLVREKRLPWRLSQYLREMRLRYTGWLRVEPDFIIIGAPKCGTTSLYNYLIQHPDVFAALEKEPRYFDQRHHEPYRWYRGNFPLRFWRGLQALRGRPLLTGESTPTYLYDPEVPARVARALPDVKIIVLLRDPVDRAFSNYNMEVKNGAEHLGFEAALEQEDQRLADRRTETQRDGTTYPYNELHFAYKRRGRYSEQLARWLAHFPPERILVFKSEDMYSEPERVVNESFSFLGLAPWRLTAYETFYRGQYGSRLAAQTRRDLTAYFAPYDAELAQQFGVSWLRSDNDD
jgi:hypothetical protein